MVQVYSIDGVTPVVHPSAFVHPTASLIGDVIVGAGCYIGPLASLRADFTRIVLKDGAIFEDGCIFHGGQNSVLHEDAVVGHGAILHGCEVRARALVGMGAVIMDGAVIGEEAFVGAKAFVKSGFQVPPRKLVTGNPGRILRDINEKELDHIVEGARVYHRLVERCHESLTPCEPLAELTPERERQQLPPYDA